MTLETAIDIRPPMKLKKSKKKAPVVSAENRYAKYLEDSDSSDQTRPDHYKKTLKAYRKPEIENSF